MEAATTRLTRRDQRKWYMPGQDCPSAGGNVIPVGPLAHLGLAPGLACHPMRKMTDVKKKNGFNVFIRFYCFILFYKVL